MVVKVLGSPCSNWDCARLCGWSSRPYWGYACGGLPRDSICGVANYPCVDYRDDGCQSDVGSLKLANHDYSIDRTMNAEVHRSHCCRNSCSSGGGPDDSANDHSCGVMDWGNKGAPTDTGYPYVNCPVQNCPLCCNGAYRFPMAVSVFGSVEVVAHEVVCGWRGAQFGGLGPCSFGSACYIRTALPYGPVNGKWGSVVMKDNQERSGQIWHISCIAVLGGTEFPRSLARQFEVYPLLMNYYDVPYPTQGRR